MLTAKIYALAWFMAIVAAGAVYLTGWFSFMALVVFGFIAATLIFTGLVAVLPSVVNHHYSPKFRVESYKTNRRATVPKRYVYR